MGWGPMSHLTEGPMSHFGVKKAMPIGPHGGSYDPGQPGEKYFSLECLLLLSTNVKLSYFYIRVMPFTHLQHQPT